MAGRKPPAPELIEQAKILKALNYSNVQIGKQLQVSEHTIRRWIAIEDDPEQEQALNAVRLEQQKRFIERAYKLADKLLDKIEAKVNDNVNLIGWRETKECATVLGILMDKRAGVEALMPTRERSEDQTVTFVLTTEGSQVENTGDAIGAPAEVPQLGVEVPSADRGSGIRENLLALPGGDPEEPGASGDGGGDSGGDLPEPSRFCAPDDKG